MERLDQYMEHLRTFSTERDWDQFYAKYPVEKSKGRITKYNKL